MLGSSIDPLCEAYDLAMLDLDGVVYVGSEPVAGAPERLAEVAGSAMRRAFITNNASRPPEAVAAHLESLGIPASAADVVTSAQAASRILLDRLGTGAAVALLGGQGLDSALRESGLSAVGVSEESAQALVSGYGPEVVWSEVMRAAVRIRDGLWWVASNIDATIPTAYGVAPGHGVLVDTIRGFAGVEPVVAGKPQRPLLDETVRRVGGDRPLMVGDRLDTDIAGARTAGLDSLLVLTGVTGLSELVAARPEERPTYIAPDLGGLLQSHPAPLLDSGAWTSAAWSARVTDGRLEVIGEGGADDWWRAVACAAWSELDEWGEVADVGGLVAPVASRP